MLVIRLQRTGRKGHAMFRVVVQDSRKSPTSGKVVAWLGSYDPHTKVVNIDTEKASLYISNGAQPSERIVRLLTSEGVKLPDWVSVASNKQRAVRNIDKRRSTRPSKTVEEAPETVESIEEKSNDTPIEQPESPDKQVAAVKTDVIESNEPTELAESTKSEDKTQAL